MDMKISGSGKIPAGEYDDIKISGSGKLFGLVKCKSFKSSGSTHGENLECESLIKSSGTLKVDGFIKTNDIKSSGTLKCKGDIKGNTLISYGSLEVEGSIEAEKIKVNGSIYCFGLLNAEDVEIKFDHRGIIDRVGGNNISIKLSNAKRIFRKLPLISPISKKVFGDFKVNNYIEGDEITIEGVNCPRVTGRVIIIEKDCEIDLVQYSENVIVSQKAKVNKLEKL